MNMNICVMAKLMHEYSVNYLTFLSVCARTKGQTDRQTDREATLYA